ncbi:Mss4p nuclear export [Borealophlyctis nickersoniae]|nr:Mss4p nuclear export [Borealophlyctis nickersoniae]
MPGDVAQVTASKKRKQTEDERSEDSDGESGEEDLEQQTVDVDFEFFDPKPIDFHGTKSLLRQTFSNDAELVHLSELADLVIAQPNVGTTVKVDGTTDPYALLTVINLNAGKDKECVKAIRSYLLDKSKKSATIQSRLTSLLNSDTSSVGLIINERLLNMPPQVVPPMFKMLSEEIEWAVEDGEPFKFDYYLFISKVYKEIESQLDEEEEGASSSKQKKKKKKAAGNEDSTVFYFQPEDEIVQQHAELTFDYKFTKEAQASDSRRAFHDFGIDPLRRVFLVHASKMTTLLKEFEENLSS